MINNIDVNYDSYYDITTVNYNIKDYVNEKFHRLWFYGQSSFKPNYYLTNIYRIRINHDLTFFNL